ncbi:leucine-rich repeat domain-containing protein [Hymenobacter persicinus]|uniref:leucine-rich repeat domain-containing protein n=1 Tax=Hymenobacter persicinus TaxID=2025506 RepID=UPI0013EE3A8E|nr:leucine-rich repeat domain-containing protein [Hymenobacter persicinus]
MKRIYRRTLHWQESQTRTKYLRRADIIGGTELDSGRFEVLQYSYSSTRPYISDTWYSKELFVRVKQIANLPISQPLPVPNSAFSVIGYDRATWHFEQFRNITGTVTRLNNSPTQPRLRLDLQYVNSKGQQKPLVRGTFTFRLDSTYFQRTRKDFQGHYDDLRLALKEPAKVRSLDLTTYAIQYEKRNGRDSGPDTLYSRLGELYNLDSLRLHLSGLPRLPAGFEKLKRLKKLDLSYNHLTEFPTVLYQLDSLQELNLEYNRLDSIPASISRLKSLRVLNLDDNRLVRYPEAVNGLTSLRKLSLGNANLRIVPGSIRRLQQLEVLGLEGFWNDKHRNQMTDLDALLALPRLRKLNLKGGLANKLPEVIYQLPLEELNVQDNGLDSADVNLRRLPKLKKLELKYYPYFPKPIQP